MTLARNFIRKLVFTLLFQETIIISIAQSLSTENPTASASECSNGTSFKCRIVNNKCIRQDQVCDFRVDCPDGSDEDDITCSGNTCSRRQFRCRNGQCIRQNDTCNGKRDCDDNSDETNCTDCDASSFKCTRFLMCISKSYVCDSKRNCPDGSDEDPALCQLKHQRCDEHGQFRCDNGQCIHNNYQNILLCNGRSDCKDGSDEANCKECDSDAFSCGNGNGGCVSKALLCNSISDCPNGSDENKINCPNGASPRWWTTFWRENSQQQSGGKNISLRLQYSDEDVAVYAEDGNLSTTSTAWPIPLLAQAWKSAKEMYGPLGDNPLLYVVLSQTKQNGCNIFSYQQRESGFRNLIDCGRAIPNENNGWATENHADFELLFSNLAHLIQRGAEGPTFLNRDDNHNDVDSSSISNYCSESIPHIVFYDMYIQLKGLTSDALQWRKEKEAEINCFAKWLLPIYNQHGGGGALNKYFEILKSHLPPKFLANRQSKELNIGEFVHFWSGATGVDLQSLAESAFTDEWNNISESQLAQARLDFLALNYEGSSGRSLTHFEMIAEVSVWIFIILFIGIGIRWYISSATKNCVPRSQDT